MVSRECWNRNHDDESDPARQKQRTKRQEANQPISKEIRSSRLQEGRKE